MFGKNVEAFKIAVSLAEEIFKHIKIIGYSELKTLETIHLFNSLVDIKEKPELESELDSSTWKVFFKAINLEYIERAKDIDVLEKKEEDDFDIMDLLKEVETPLHILELDKIFKELSLGLLAFAHKRWHKLNPKNRVKEMMKRKKVESDIDKMLRTGSLKPLMKKRSRSSSKDYSDSEEGFHVRSMNSYSSIDRIRSTASSYLKAASSYIGNILSSYFSPKSNYSSKKSKY